MSVSKRHLHPGAAVFRAPPKAKSLRAYVKFNGKVAGDFIIDTGASSVVLSRSFAEKLALTAPSRPTSCARQKRRGRRRR